MRICQVYPAADDDDDASSVPLQTLLLLDDDHDDVMVMVVVQFIEAAQEGKADAAPMVRPAAITNPAPCLLDT